LTLSLKKYWIYWVSFAFLLLNIVLIVNEIYFGLALPIAIVVLWMAIYAYDKLWYLVVFATPLSINVVLPGGVGFYFPTEPILFGLMGIVVLREMTEQNIDNRIFSHPITRIIMVYLLWIFITAMTSSMPMVSFKFFLVKLWFISVMYFLAITIFKSEKKILLFFILYLAGLTIVVLYTLIKHAGYSFDEETAHWIMSPFFKDHTVYGALLAFYYPVIIGMLFLKRIKKPFKIFLFTILILFSIALVYSYTRAAWVSLLGSLVVGIVMLLKINYRTVITAVALVVLLFFMYQDTLIYKLGKNSQDSSNNLTEHVESMSNITTDASNLERLNRWSSAWRMFQQRPVFGWGPGTYQFKYAPFQKASETTIITTRTGDQGNAHSEYLGPLAEQGLPGTIIFLVLAFGVTILAFKVYGKLPPGDTRIIVLMTYLGLVTYFIHGVLNNYLDTDKASVPFWGFIAVLVAIDLYHNDDSVRVETKSQIT
jgi:O-antigen ligase